MGIKYSIRDNIIYILMYFKPYKKRIAWTIVFFVLKLIPHMLPPVIIGFIIDNYIPAAEMKSIIILLLFTSVLFILHVIFHVSYALNTEADVIKRAIKDIRRHLVQKLQILSLGFHKKFHSGRIFSKLMVDMEKIDSFATQFIVHILQFLIISIFTLTILAVTNIRLLLLYLFIIPVYVLFYKAIVSKMQSSQHELRIANERLNRLIGGFIQTKDLARMHGEEEWEYNRVQEGCRTELIRTRTLQYYTSFFGSVVGCSAQIFSILIVAIGGSFVIKNSLSLGALILFLQYITMIINQITQLINVFPMLTRFNEAVDSIREIFDSSDVEYNIGKPQVKKIKAAIHFENVSFSFPDGQQVFKDLTVTVESGQTVALVGSSGSGKSTFVNLILGLYRPDEGIIKIDGIPISEIDMRSLRQKVGVVTQQAIIFPGSIRENISYAHRDYHENDIIKAAKDAGAYEFIMQMPAKFDTIVGEYGTSLSGGQKQRISIARALLRKPQMLILDEATSALDSQTEFEVQEAIEKFKGKQTTFIIAHRLSTIFHADRILVFKNSTIVEDGPHSELSQKGGEYSRLLSIQMNISHEKVKNLAVVSTG